MILVINICKEKLHYYEFVKPIENILKTNGIKFFTKNYKEVSKVDLKKADKTIICGTSLYDNEFIQNTSYFEWIRNFNKPLLGICGGMQIIGILCGGKIAKHTEIGYFKETFNKEFLGLRGVVEVYHLHNYYLKNVGLKPNGFLRSLEPKNPFAFFWLKPQSVRKEDFFVVKIASEFLKYNIGMIPQAIKHMKKDIYGVLFHPEVRNKDLIIEFCLSKHHGKRC